MFNYVRAPLITTIYCIFQKVVDQNVLKFGWWLQPTREDKGRGSKKLVWFVKAVQAASQEDTFLNLNARSFKL